MASLTKSINRDFFNSILPTYGNPRVAMPSYSDDIKAFICNQYESAKGHRYYTALRFCDNIAIAEKVALAYQWTYINSIEIYAFNGKNFELIQKKDFDLCTYHNADFVKAETMKMLESYIKSTLKISGRTMPENQIRAEVESLVNKSYKSLLDEDYNLRLTSILPQIEHK